MSNSSPDGSVELAIIGGGNMGSALLGGLLASGVLAVDEVAVVELNDARCSEITNEFGVVAGPAVPPCQSAIIAVKPQHVVDAVAAAVGQGAERILSVAAGVTVTSMLAVDGDLRVIRAMPNTPALVGRGVTAICAGGAADDADLTWAESILGGVGIVVRVDESEIDAVTGLTGSGPAYVFLVAESLIEAGREVGLPEDLLEPMVTQLLVGSSALLAERGDPAALRDAVTSPGGTTERGLAVLAENGLREAFVAAVAAATERGRELGS